MKSFSFRCLKFISCAALLFLINACSSSGNKRETIIDEIDETPITTRVEQKETETLQNDEYIPEASADNKIIVIDFYATWCGPCKQLAPYFEKWINTYGKAAEFQKVDIDQEQMMSEEYEITAVPTIVVLTHDGEEIGRVEGNDPEAIENLIKSAIANNN